MNELIKDLLTKAGADVKIYGGVKTHIDKSKLDVERFAELIVQECIEQASISNGHGNNQWDKALTFAANNIKAHFGVK